MGLVEISEEAAQYVLENIVQESKQRGVAEDTLRLRVAIKGGGCAGFQYNIHVDQQREGDTVVKYNGKDLILVDSQSALYVTGIKIEYTAENLQR